MARLSHTPDRFTWPIASVGMNNNAARTQTHNNRTGVILHSRFVGLAEIVPDIGYGKCTVRLGRYLDPIGRPVMYRRGRRLATCRSLERSNRHCGLRLIDGIRNKHAGNRVFLSAEL